MLLCIITAKFGSLVMLSAGHIDTRDLIEDVVSSDTFIMLKICSINLPSGPDELLFEEVHDQSREAFKEIALTWSGLFPFNHNRGAVGYPVVGFRGRCFQNSIFFSIRNAD